MTPAQRERRARKYRLSAGALHYDMCKAKEEGVSQEVEANIRAAHDALCRAFTLLERTS